MTLLELIDDRLMSGFVKVYSSDGKEIAIMEEGDESGLSKIRDYANGEVIREVSLEGGVAAYVKAKPMPKETVVYKGYPGELADEAAFSLDWRSREPKASPKQVAYLYKNIRAYIMIKKPQWPQDPQHLLRYEASDAMTAIIEMKRKKGGSKNG